MRKTRCMFLLACLLVASATQSNATEIQLHSVGGCVEASGATVIVNVDLRNAATPVVGGQFFVQYDSSYLQFVSMEPGSAPFVVEVFEAAPGDGGAGTIDYAVSTVSGAPGTTSDVTMATITFTALQTTCSVSGLLGFRSHTPPNRLSDPLGGEVTATFVDLPPLGDSTQPEITCPIDVVVDATESTDPSNTGVPVATDNCTVAPTLDYTDELFPASCPLTNIIQRTWVATDTCGLQDTCVQSISIRDTDSDGDNTVDCQETSTEIYLNSSPQCYNMVGANVIVTIDLRNAGVPPVGGQFFLQYDASALQFVSAQPGDNPFVVEVYEAVPGDGGSGTIDFAVSTVSGGAGTLADTTMAVLTFTAIGSQCNPSGLLTFRLHTPPSRLSDAEGEEIFTTFFNLNGVQVDVDSPIITCPATAVVPANGSSDPPATGVATANDNCDPDPTIQYSDESSPLACPVVTMIERTWTAEDSCGRIASCVQIVLLFDEDGDNDGTVDCEDNCPFASNPTQDDIDNDGAGDACDCGDGVCHDLENQCDCSVDCGAPPLAETPNASCSDGLDNDCDGQTDCQDFDCAIDLFCSCGNALCTPGENPCNCTVDCGAFSASETIGLNCTDLIDNDCDGLTDCVDADCTSDPDCLCGDAVCLPTEICTCLQDCGSPPVSEAQGVTCTDGLDNDCDNRVDCADEDCSLDLACSCGDAFCTIGENPCNCAKDCGSTAPEVANVNCGDSIDNDCDGLADCADPDCAGDLNNPYCDGDSDDSGTINQLDLLMIGNCVNCDGPQIAACDVNCDGQVNLLDLGDELCLLFFPPEQCCDALHGACLNTSIAQSCVRVPEVVCDLLSGQYLGDDVACPPGTGDCNGNDIGDGCETHCVTDHDCNDYQVCTCDRCICNVCYHQPIEYGDVNCDCVPPNLDDILCVLRGFAHYNDCAAADIHPPCTGQGIINLDDILAVLAAFAGTNPCFLVCGDVSCPVGACCDGASCSLNSPSRCLSDGNTFKGDGSVCPPLGANPCP